MHPTQITDISSFPFRIEEVDGYFEIQPLSEEGNLPVFRCLKSDILEALRDESVFQITDGGGFFMMKVWKGQVSTICAAPALGFRLNHVTTSDEWQQLLAF